MQTNLDRFKVFENANARERYMLGLLKSRRDALISQRVIR
jgi:hypothetical protein